MAAKEAAAGVIQDATALAPGRFEAQLHLLSKRIPTSLEGSRGQEKKGSQAEMHGVVKQKRTITSDQGEEKTTPPLATTETLSAEALDEAITMIATQPLKLGILRRRDTMAWTPTQLHLDRQLAQAAITLSKLGRADGLQRVTMARRRQVREIAGRLGGIGSGIVETIGPVRVAGTTQAQRGDRARLRGIHLARERGTGAEMGARLAAGHHHLHAHQLRRAVGHQHQAPPRARPHPFLARTQMLAQRHAEPPLAQLRQRTSSQIRSTMLTWRTAPTQHAVLLRVHHRARRSPLVVRGLHHVHRHVTLASHLRVRVQIVAMVRRPRVQQQVVRTEHPEALSSIVEAAGRMATKAGIEGGRGQGRRRIGVQDCRAARRRSARKQSSGSSGVTAVTLSQRRARFSKWLPTTLACPQS